MLDTARQEETLRSVWNYILRFKDYKYGGLRLLMLFRVDGRNFVMVRDNGGCCRCTACGKCCRLTFRRCWSCS